eukprot:COSAG01_NODE_1176_length_11374_cov_476.847805_8_plen_73_part_00
MHRMVDKLEAATKLDIDGDGNVGGEITDNTVIIFLHRETVDDTNTLEAVCRALRSVIVENSTRNLSGDAAIG